MGGTNTAFAVFSQPHLRFDGLPRLRLNPIMNMGARVRAERQSKGLTQQQLAALCGPPVTQTTIQSIEDRNSKKSSHAGAIAEALGVNLGWLLTGEGSKTAKDIHPLVSKLAAAIQAGQLTATALDMLEAALDSQLVKAARLPGSNVAVPPPAVLVELRTAQLAADAGTATPESISAMNRRIRSRSNAERNRAESSVMGDGERRNKKDR